MQDRHKRNITFAQTHCDLTPDPHISNRQTPDPGSVPPVLSAYSFSPWSCDPRLIVFEVLLTSVSFIHILIILAGQFYSPSFLPHSWSFPG